MAKQEADAQPFFWLALSGANYDLLQLSDIGDRLVKARLQTLPGVGQARIFGERRFSMRVWLSAAELSARGLTVQDVQQAIRTRNVEVPAGRIESDRREFTVRSLGELKTPEEFSELVVSNDSGVLVKLKDLGRVELGAEDERSALRYKGTSAVAIGVVRQSKANIIQVADAIRHELPRVQESLPPGVKLSIAFDESIFVSRSIREAEETLILAAGLVVIIIFVFLRNLRATIIPGLAIPTSIVATFAIMYFLGFSINNFTLLALTLAIGIVVDDAIIVLENAYRHQEELGESPEEAADQRHPRDRLRGHRDDHLAGRGVHAAGVPQGLDRPAVQRVRHRGGGLGGDLGLRRPHAHADALRQGAAGAAAARRAVPGARERLQRAGLGLRADARARRSATAGRSCGAVVLLTLGAARRVPLAQAGVRAARGQGLVLLHHHRARGLVAGLHRRLPAAGGGGARQDQGRRELLQRGEPRRRGEPRDDLHQPGGLRAAHPLDPGHHRRGPGRSFFGIPGVFAFANNPPAFGFGSPVQFVLQNPDFDLLVKGNDTLLARARQVKGLVNVDSDLRVNKPELTVNFDRDRAEDLGVPVGDVATTLQVLLGGNRTSTFTRDNKQYDVIVQLDPRARATPSDMTGLYVRGRGRRARQARGAGHA